MPATTKLIRFTSTSNSIVVNPLYVTHTTEGKEENYIHIGEDAYYAVTPEELTNFNRQWRAFLEGIVL